MPRIKKTARRPVTRSKMGGVTVSVQRCNRPGCTAAVIMRQGGRRLRQKFLATLGEAEHLAQAWTAEITNSGTAAAAAIGDSDKRKFMECKASLEPYGKTIWQAVEYYVAHLERCKASITVELLADKLLTRKKLENKSTRYLADLEGRLKPFLRDFGTRIASDVSTEDISHWLIALELSPVSVSNYRRVLSVLFSHGVKLKAVDKDKNPAKGAFQPESVEGEIGFLSVAQACALLKAANDEPEILPAVALGLFAGIRTIELQRMDWKDVSLSRGYVTITAANAKTKTKRKIAIMPALRSWLAPVQALSGPIWPAKQQRGRNIFEAVRETAGFDEKTPWPHNAMRHSFGSYHAAKFQNIAALSLEMGNSPNVVDKHYRNADVEKKDAEKFWSLTRKRVLRSKVLVPSSIQNIANSA